MCVYIYVCVDLARRFFFCRLFPLRCCCEELCHLGLCRPGPKLLRRRGSVWVWEGGTVAAADAINGGNDGDVDADNNVMFLYKKVS